MTPEKARSVFHWEAPPGFTPKIVHKFLKAVAHGLPPAQAATLYGVTEENLDNAIRDFIWFKTQIARAEAVNIACLLKKLRKPTSNWRLHAWLLERRYPDRFSRALARG